MAGLAIKVIGTIGLASYAFARVCSKLGYLSYHRFKVVAVHFEGLPAMPAGYTWRPLDRDDLARHPINVDREAQEDRIARGLECIGVFDRNRELAGVTWLSRLQHHDSSSGLRYHLPPNAAWDTGLWVPEDKRMTRAFSAVWAAIGEWLKRERLAWTISAIADSNIPSILSHRRLGARDLRWFVVVRLGRLQISFGAKPFVRFRAGARPSVRILAPVMEPSHASETECPARRLATASKK